MGFIRYQHIERYGSVEVEDIELGECYVFPKIDGTNSSVWLEDGELKAGSRNRLLSLEEDNAGFYATILTDANIKRFLVDNPNLRLYGEFLCPHTLRTYRDSAWRKFYVFDVVDSERYLSYNEYAVLLSKYGIEYIPPLAIITNGVQAQFYALLDKNNYLIRDGDGVGEGIVIKRYNFKNRFGRTTWAKIVTSEFKENNAKLMGAPAMKGVYTVEQNFVDTYCTKALIEKELAKIALTGWESKKIPQLLGTVYYSLITECFWDFIKKNKNPTVDFGRVLKLCNEKTKVTLPTYF